MKKLSFLLLLVPYLALADTCDTQSVLSQIRPGEEWSMAGNNFSSLVWISPTPPPTLAELNAGIAACPNKTNLLQRTDALNDLLSSKEGRDKLIRAFGLVLVDENNLNREWIQAFKGQVALATSLADLKTRVATLPDMPDRTVQQAKTAVQNKINSGDSD